MVKIYAVGGYDEVGKNCTALEVGNEAVLFDLGIHLDSYIKYTEDEDIVNINANELMKVGAVPDISVLKDINVKAIIVTHAHLDHCGAIPYLANKFGVPIICSPYTAEVIKAILRDEEIKINNKIIVLNAGSSYRISKDIKVEFVNMTHSTPQTVMAVVHTKNGKVLYANDFKFDRFPVLGKKPDFKRMKELGKEGVLAAIVDSTYSSSESKMPSESVAKQMLKDVLLGVDSVGKAVIVTTFASHLARLKSIIEIGKKLNRKIVFLGRSLAKYVEAGENIGLVNFSKEVEIVKYGSKIKKRLKKIEEKGSEKYLLVVTGHQGEPKSTLSKMANSDIFKFRKEDHVIFSCRVIPTPTNEENRRVLERDLKDLGVRIFKDIHVSGHCAKEDLRDFIHLVKPKHLVPAHGGIEMRSALQELAVEMGYNPKKNVHLLGNGEKVEV
ncbi:MAG: RNase J family beta-CASP ribonuclease [Candidatus Woesearchaeota archaeon]|jgi:ribonuclease J|nr:RNase J family beta-CASP ribonuclease [Candidatus Woesearchaeota archaeon]MDP7506096.1 RNase J family beta-CASP ribonuclease [Candidatus Woesearchaeota archaeon]MDP7610416.1 RNase J family beta-CASP ribonuclease [Candidatus Woesearchaeota archaeon]|tara:strand:+ start:4582 stop:5904 length:1323 start_codon:yes stop_codon:yes gene_type:complete